MPSQTPKPRLAVAADLNLPEPTELCIRTATMLDLAYILDRAKRWRKRIGWIPRSGLQLATSLNWIWITEANGQPAGYVLISGGVNVPYVLRHNTVELDLWSRGLGRLQTEIYLSYAQITGRHPIARVRTRSDILEQNVINLTTGAQIADLDDAAKWARGRRVATWVWQLATTPERHREARDTPAEPLQIDPSRRGGPHTVIGNMGETSRGRRSPPPLPSH